MSTPNSFFRNSFVAKQTITQPVTLRNDFGKIRLLPITADGSVMAKETIWVRSQKDENGRTVLSSTMAKVRLPEGGVLQKLNGRVTSAKETDIVPKIGKGKTALRLNSHLVKTFSHGWMIGQKQEDGYSQSFTTWFVMDNAMVEACNEKFGFDITEEGVHIQLWNIGDGEVLGTTEFAGAQKDWGIKATAPVEREAVVQVKKPTKKTAKKAAKKVATL